MPDPVEMNLNLHAHELDVFKNVVLIISSVGSTRLNLNFVNIMIIAVS